MHGQKRAEYKSRLLNPEVATKLATKAQQWNHLSHELLTQRKRLFSPPIIGGTTDAKDDAADGAVKSPSPSAEILLTLTEKMLSVNPDPSHLWNIRREMLLFVPPRNNDAEKKKEEEKEDDSAPPNYSSSSSCLDIKAELTLTAHCLQRNPKSYSSWYHRKWSLIYFLTHGNAAPSTTITASFASNSFEEAKDEDNAGKQQHQQPQEHLDSMKSILTSELDLCAQFLQMDERNFHCWNYRRFVVALLGSCGGSGDGSATATANDNAGFCSDISDGELFSGSWSSWLNQTKVSMGAQLSNNAISARGATAPATDEETPSTPSCVVSKSIHPLSKQELEEIIKSEWEFTSSKIQYNFSNGSAFHYRSKLLPLILETRLPFPETGDEDSGNDRYDAILSLARDEWENIILNAIFTEPDDQTPWWYHRFIVSWAKPSSNDLDAEMVEEYEGLLVEMADSLRELLEVERENNDMLGNAESKDESKGAKCKWAYIGLHLLLSTLLESKSLDEDEAAELREEARECLTELIKIDPNRKERYQSLAL